MAVAGPLFVTLTRLEIAASTNEALLRLFGPPINNYLLQSVEDITGSNWIERALLTPGNQGSPWFNAGPVSNAQTFFRAVQNASALPMVRLTNLSPAIAPGGLLDFGWDVGDLKNIEMIVRLQAPGW
jgi:hypothetical protein